MARRPDRLIAALIFSSLNRLSPPIKAARAVSRLPPSHRRPPLLHRAAASAAAVAIRRRPSIRPLKPLELQVSAGLNPPRPPPPLAPPSLAAAAPRPPEPPLAGRPAGRSATPLLEGKKGRKRPLFHLAPSLPLFFHPKPFPIPSLSFPF